MHSAINAYFYILFHGGKVLYISFAHTAKAKMEEFVLQKEVRGGKNK